MTNRDDERYGGRNAFCIGLGVMLIWLIAGATATGELTFPTLLGMGIIFAASFLIASWIGLYNLGRRRGR